MRYLILPLSLLLLAGCQTTSYSGVSREKPLEYTCTATKPNTHEVGTIGYYLQLHSEKERFKGTHWANGKEDEYYFKFQRVILITENNTRAYFDEVPSFMRDEFTKYVDSDRGRFYYTHKNYWDDEGYSVTCDESSYKFYDYPQEPYSYISDTKPIYVTGHWRTTPSGGKTWVNQHWRNSP